MTGASDPVALAEALIACESVTPARGAVFDALEIARIEALGARAMGGVRDNLSHLVEARVRADAIVRARLQRQGLAPAPEADKATLIRRVYLDLVGYPPALAKVDAFLQDQSPDAYEKVVDHLLASPHYGERWARRWLDLAR